MRPRRGRHLLEIVQLLLCDLAGRIGANRLKHLLDRDVLALVVAGPDRAAVKHQAGDIQTRERHHRTGDRLVAARDRHQRIEGMRGGDKLDRIGDQLA